MLHRFRFKKPVHAICFSPNDSHFAVGVGKTVQVWVTPGVRREYSPFVLHRTYTGLSNDVVSIDWTKDSRFFVAGSMDNTARVFSLNSIENFEPTSLAGHKGPIIGAYFGQESTAIYTVSVDGAVVTWGWEGEGGGEEEEEREGEGEGEDNNKSKRKRNPEELVDGQWMLKKRHFFNQENADVSCTSMDEQKSLLVVGFTTGVFGLYEMPGVTNIHTLSVSQHLIKSVAINPSGDWLAFGCPNLGQLLVWEWQSESYVLKQQGHSYAMNAMAYSPDSQHIVTGGEDGKVKVRVNRSGERSGI